MKLKRQKVGLLKFAKSFLDYANVESNKNGIYRLIDAVIYSNRDIIKLLILIDTYSSFI